MIVALTGGIASGKTFCSDYLNKQYNITIIDADQISREVVALGSDGLAAIAQQFGKSVLNTDGSLNRSKMRAIIMTNDAARHKLNNITHPRVREMMLNRLQATQQKNTYRIMSVPLLIENSLQCYADTVVVIDVDTSTQVNRLCHRDQTDSTSAYKMLATQISRHERLRHAQFIIDNNADKKNTIEQLDILHIQLTRLLTAKSL